jgi:hypothetical protein
MNTINNYNPRAFIVVVTDDRREEYAIYVEATNSQTACMLAEVEFNTTVGYEVQEFVSVEDMGHVKIA